MLLALQLWACKKRELVELPTPAKTLNVEPFKMWHQNNPLTWHSLKSFNQRSIDSLPFFPQWDRAKFIQKSNGNKVIFVPIYRELYVAYTNHYDFVRRLRIEANASNEVLQASIIEVLTARGSIPQEESDLINYLENPQTGLFSGIIFVYNLQYQHQNNQYWENGVLLQENLPMKMEQESNPVGRSDCDPVFAYVWVSEPCPNEGQPSHTGHFCLHLGHWERVMVGYDCHISSLPSNINPNGGAGANPGYWSIPDDFGFLTGCCGSLGGDTGSNLGGPRGNQIFDPIEEARVLNQLNEITESYSDMSEKKRKKLAYTRKKLAYTLDNLIKSSSAYKKMYNLVIERNHKITWESDGSISGKAQAKVTIDNNGKITNKIKFKGIHAIENESTVAEEIIHILQLNRRGRFNENIKASERACIEFEAKCIIKFIAATATGRAYDTDSLFEPKEPYKSSDMEMYNNIALFEDNMRRFINKT